MMGPKCEGGIGQNDHGQTPHLLRYHLLGVLCWLYPVGYPRIICMNIYIHMIGILLTLYSFRSVTLTVYLFRDKYFQQFNTLIYAIMPKQKKARISIYIKYIDIYLYRIPMCAIANILFAYTDTK